MGLVHRVSSLAQHHHLRVHLCEQVPGQAGRGAHLQRLLATAMLHRVILGDSTPLPTPLTIHNNVSFQGFIS
jgi:hypothetical protein